MKAKRWLFTVLLAIVAVGCSVAVACENEVPEGPETGVYYNDVNADEYIINLYGGNVVSTWINDVTKTGTYSVEGEALSMSFADEEVTATIKDDVITMNIGGSPYQFLKKIPYTVSFDTKGGSAVEDATVINGKTLFKPAADPVKTNSAFLGWFEDEGFTVPFAFDSKPVKGNVTLYAQWAEQRPGQATYEVELDYCDGKTENKVLTTIGGKLYNLETPVREGYTFNGWWLSDVNDGDKLTDKYSADTVFTSDDTLFADWIANGTLKPEVVVDETGVRWSAISSTGNLKIEGPAGFTAVNASIGAGGVLSYDPKFAKAPEGVYTVTFTVGETVVVRSYVNKALDRVSGLKVIGNSLLVFDPVSNPSAKYFITVDCGNKNHSHAFVDNGTSTNYTFSGCEMQPGGIKFTVTARADGYADSVSKVYCYDKTLDRVSGYDYDEETAILVWERVQDAAGYLVTVNDGNPVDVGYNTSFDLKAYSGELNVSVVAKTPGYNNSVATSCKIVKNTLATPSGLNINVNTLSWEEVKDAQGYEITVNYGDGFFKKTVTGTETTFDLTDDGLANIWSRSADYKITVKALGASAAVNSIESDTLDARYYAMGRSLKYSDGYVYWNPVIGVTMFTVTVNGMGAQVIANGSGRAKINLRTAGYNTVKVQFACKDASGEVVDGEATLDVYAYEIALDTRGGTISWTDGGAEYIYRALGDSFNLPSTTREGYELDGWYNVPGGAEGNGLKYSDGKFKDGEFKDGGNIVLYAYWTPKEYTVELEYGEYGEAPSKNDLTATVKYQQHYTLPVPKITNELMRFDGWFDAEENGNRYTESDGNSVARWNETPEESKTLYAHYILDKTLVYELDEERDGYAVKAGDDVNEITHLVIPTYYLSKPVVAIYDNAFKDCVNFLTVSLPNTIEIIDLLAFTGCTNITSYEVRDEGVADPVYFSDSGTLLHKNIMTGEMELAALPKLTSSVYTIPGAVTALPAGCFTNQNFVEIIIPETVTYVAAGAFVKCMNLETVTFSFSVDPSMAKPLVMSLDAFSSSSVNYTNANSNKCCYNIKTITFPARLQAFDIEEYSLTTSFRNLKFLTEINVEQTPLRQYNLAYTSVNGMLCNKEQDTILAYPAAKPDTKLEIPSGILHIGSGAFHTYGNSGSGAKNALTEIVFHANMRSIGDNAFYNCQNLAKVTFKASASHPEFIIGDDAFNCGSSNNSKLATIIFEEEGDYVTSVKGGVTYYEFRPSSTCNVVSIGESAFEYCRETDLLIPSTVKSLGMHAFNQNTNLNNLDLSHMSADIVFGTSPFFTCRALNKVTITKNVGLISFSTLFSYCSEFVVDEDNPYYSSDESGIIYDRNHTRIIFFPANFSAEQYIIPENITVIENYVFSGKTSLKEITVPASVKEIGAYAFDGCSNLSKINFIPGGEEQLKIGNYAFQNCAKLTSITLPSRTVSLGDKAFYGCRLSSVVLNEGLETIGAEVFREMTSLTSVTIPSTVKSIGSNAFYKCGLTGENGIMFAATPEGKTPVALTMGQFLFAETNIIDIVLPERLVAIPNSAFYNCTKLVSVTIPTTVANDGAVRGVGNMAFYGCVKLTDVNFNLGGDKPLSFDRNAFGNSPTGETALLEELTLPARVTSMSDILYDLFAFGDVQSSTYYYEDEVVYAGFVNCNLKNINIAEDDTYTEGEFQSKDGVLYTKDLKVLVWCPSLHEFADGKFIVPKETETFRYAAFNNCMNLRSIEFEEGGTADFYMDDFASEMQAYQYHPFSRCKNLLEINFPARLRNLGNYALFLTNSAEYQFLLNSVTFADGEGEAASRLTKIGNNVFKGHTNLTSLVLPSKVNEIGETPLAGSGITSVTISKSMTVENITALIGNNTNITIIIPTDSETMSVGDDGIVYNKERTQIVYLPREFEENTTVTVPYTITEIAPNAFRGVAGVSEIVFEETPEGTEPVDLTVGEYAFACDDLKTIKLPARLKTLGPRAFYGCTSLTKVEFAEDTALTTIPEYTFYQSGITSIEIPDSVESIGMHAFRYAKSLTSVTINTTSKLKSLGTYLFDNCTELTTITLPNNQGFTTLPYNVFSNTKLNSIVIPDCITTIGNNAFSGCGELTSVTMSTSCASVGDGAFKNCAKLTGIVFGGQTTRTIGNSAFYGCTKLATLDLTNVTGIGMAAFAKCTSLTSVTIPGSVTNITNGTSGTSADKLGAFSGCTGLTSVTVNIGVRNNPAAIGNYTFYGCTKLSEVKIGQHINKIGESAFQGCGTSSTEMTVDFAENSNLTSIGKNAFSGANKLQTIQIPAKVTTIGDSAFQNCTALTSFVASPVLTAVPKSMCNGCTNLLTVDISAASLKTIGESAFNNCKLLNVVSIGANVTMISKGAFQNCEKLVGVELPASLTILGYVSATSDASVFNGCKALKTITIPAGVKVLCNNTFKGCTSLTDVYLSGIETISATAFANCTNYQFKAVPGGAVQVVEGALINSLNMIISFSGNGTELSIPEGVVGIIANAFKGKTNLQKMTLPSTCLTIGESAFEACTGLREINLEHVMEFGKKAFFGCTNLAEIDLQSVTEIGESAFENIGMQTFNFNASRPVKIAASAFRNQKKLKELTFTGSLGTNQYLFYKCIELVSATLNLTDTTLPQDIFSGCSKLETVTITGPVTEVGKGMFKDCTLLKTVELPSTVTTIGYGAFENCTSFTAADIDFTKITAIGGSAFKKCSAITSISLPNLKTIGVNYGTIKDSGTWSFSGTGITSFKVPDAITALPQQIFQDCKSLATVDLNNVTSLGQSAFSGCTLITERSMNLSKIKSFGSTVFDSTGIVNFVMPAGIKTVPNGLLQNCAELLTVDFGDATSIAQNAFKGCAKLDNVTLPSAVVSIESSTFENCTSLTSIDLSKVTNIGQYAFRGCSALSDVTMNTSAEVKISNAPFQNCTSLTSIDLSHVSNITSTGGLVGTSAFSGCSKLKTVTMSSITRISNEFFKGTAIESIDLSKVTEIGTSAFENCTSLKTVTMNTNVNVKVGNNMFKGCTSLTGINLSKAQYTSTSTGTSSFENCTSLSDVTMPITAFVSTSMFKGCTSLKEIDLSHATSIYNGAFEGCTSLKDVTFNPSSTYTIGDTAFKGCTSLVSLDLSKATSFGKNSFENCTNLQTVTMNTSSAVTLGNYAFQNCTSLESIDLSKVNNTNATTYCTYAFKGCTALKNVTINNAAKATVTAISNYMFDGCTSLESIDLSKVSIIGSYAFRNCTSLNDIENLEKATKIDTYAFQKCTAIKAIEIKSGVTKTIGASAFDGWSSATQKIYVPGIFAKLSGWNAKWFGTDANVVVWNTAKPLPHSCESVCEVCGGCTDEACQEAACVNKCTCHKCKHVCETCHKCTSECDDPACADKCECAPPVTETHECKHVCPEVGCGKCTSECNDPACADKCTGHDTEGGDTGETGTPSEGGGEQAA